MSQTEKEKRWKELGINGEAVPELTDELNEEKEEVKE